MFMLWWFSLEFLWIIQSCMYGDKVIVWAEIWENTTSSVWVAQSDPDHSDEGGSGLWVTETSSSREKGVSSHTHRHTVAILTLRNSWISHRTNCHWLCSELRKPFAVLPTLLSHGRPTRIQMSYCCALKPQASSVPSSAYQTPPSAHLTLDWLFC